MKKFIITESRPATYIWTYEVEAEDQNEALQKVFNGDVEIVDTEIVPDLESDGGYEITDEEELD